MPQARVDWAAAEREYVSGSMSLREIARRYGAACSTVQKQAERHNWRSKRERMAVKVEEKTASRVADDNAAAYAELTACVRKSIKLCAKWLDKADDGCRYDPAMVNQLNLALAKAKELLGNDPGAANTEAGVIIMPAVIKRQEPPADE